MHNFSYGHKSTHLAGTLYQSLLKVHLAYLEAAILGEYNFVHVFPHEVSWQAQELEKKVEKKMWVNSIIKSVF